MLDVTPLSLSVGYDSGDMSALINRNTTVPTKQVRVYTTKEDNQHHYTRQVYEGEGVMTKDCVSTTVLHGQSVTKEMKQTAIIFEKSII